MLGGLGWRGFGWEARMSEKRAVLGVQCRVMRSRSSGVDVGPAGLGLGRWWCDSGRDVVEGDVEFAVWWDAEFPEVGGHSVTSGGEKVAVQPGGEVVLAGG